MDPNLKHQRLSILLHTVIGIVVGYISLYFSRFWYALGVVIIIEIIVVLANKKIVGPKDSKFWAANIFVYIMIWLLSWVIFFNILHLPIKIF